MDPRLPSYLQKTSTDLRTRSAANRTPARLSAASSSRTATNCATAKSMSSKECAAESCVRMRAAPRGTTGNEKLTA